MADSSEKGRLNSEKILVVIAGPTASGKTELAIHLASLLDTEILSADSRQVFRELTIGTAKPSAMELQKARHYFVDILSIAEDYDAASYARDALAALDEIFAHRDAAILCGGSGLYIRAVCEGFDEIPDVDPAIRAELLQQYTLNGLPWLQEKLRTLDPSHFSSIDIHNPHRLIRALEVIIGTGMSITAFRTREKKPRQFKTIKIGLELPRDVLFERIDKRMDKMIGDGLFTEAQQLYSFRMKNALQTVGYQEIFDYLDGKYDKSEAVRLLKRNSRRYAKRQLTWFRKDPEFTWFDPRERDAIVSYLYSRIKKIQQS